MEISKRKKWVTASYDKGYRVTESGSVTNPYGKTVTGYITKRGNMLYKAFSIKVEGISRSVRVHQLASYQKFGKDSLSWKPGI